MAVNRPGLLPGVLIAALGLGIYVMTHLYPAGANAPAFVIDAAAGTFFFAGVSVIALALGAPLLSRIASLAVVYLLAVPGLWLLLGQDTGSCSVGIAVGGIGSSGTGDATLCRAVFGTGGLIVLAFAIGFTVSAIRAGRAPRDPGPAA